MAKTDWYITSAMYYKESTMAMDGELLSPGSPPHSTLEASIIPLRLLGS